MRNIAIWCYMVSSVCLCHQGLHAINLGDSGFIVVRDGCTVFQSPVQQHGFNFTYQLESGNGGDLPSSGQVSKRFVTLQSCIMCRILESYIFLLIWKNSFGFTFVLYVGRM